MRLTWKRQANETGLARVCQSPRGFDLRAGGRYIGGVRPHRVDRFGRYAGWYWYAVDDTLRIGRMNTNDSPVLTIEEAKSECIAYVRACLAKAATE